MEDTKLNLFKGFSSLDHSGRLQKLKDLSYLDEEGVRFLKSSQKLPVDFAEDLIENVLGYFEMPLGVAVNFIINNKPFVLPLAVEETSIIAAASKTARWVCENGTITTEVLGCLSIGQIQIAKVKNKKQLEGVLKESFPVWKKDVNQGLLAHMVQRGGGLEDWNVRFLNRPDGEQMAVIHLLIDTCDAMGANLINQVCEYVKEPLEKASGEKVNMCILSNLADQRMIRSKVIIKNQDKDLIHRIEEASLFAELDPYRAATSNKGVLNGVDALLMATGNDWRAVESGLHAYAGFKSQHYTSLTKWRVKGTELHGTMEGPFMLGSVGGVTNLHPMAQLCFKMLGSPKAEELASLCCALGLVQNLGAIRALVTEGIIEGHMKLHIKNLVLKAGAKSEEKVLLEEHLVNVLKKTKRISLTQACKDLDYWRKHQRWS